MKKIILLLSGVFIFLLVGCNSNDLTDQKNDKERKIELLEDENYILANKLKDIEYLSTKLPYELLIYRKVAEDFVWKFSSIEDDEEFEDKLKATERLKGINIVEETNDKYIVCIGIGKTLFSKGFEISTLSIRYQENKLDKGILEVSVKEKVDEIIDKNIEVYTTQLIQIEKNHIPYGITIDTIMVKFNNLQ